MNKIVLLGRLTRAPEIRYTDGEKATAVTRFTLAVNKKFKKDEADFIPCVAFGKTAEAIEKYMSKGSRILIQGAIATSSYKDKEGNYKNSWNVNVDSFEFIDKKDDKPTESPTENDFVPVDENDGDLPF